MSTSASKRREPSGIGSARLCDALNDLIGGSETFADVGGQAQIIEFLDGLMRGRQPVTLIVRVEENEKSLAEARTDTSGVSQDALQMLLTAMEDEDYTSLIAVGPRGSGKSLYSKALGNTYGVLSVSLDPGGLKESLVGQSEQAIRNALQVIKSVAGRGGALWVVTCDKLDVIPPELRRRLRLGTWFFDLPDADEKRAIWTLNEARYGLPTNPELRPEDSNYTGSDIRNLCKIAWRLNCSLVDATRFLVSVATLDPDGLASLRKLATGRFLNATSAGLYRER